MALKATKVKDGMRTYPSSEERHALEVNKIMIGIQQGA
jgi:hypothetical protein